MSYLKLIKLLYLLDREALLRWGRPVSQDRYVSMDNGPVLSRTYDLIVEGTEQSSFWCQHISIPERYEVYLLKPAPSDELSEAEEELIDEIFQKYGRLSRWDLVRLTHKLPEWRDPEGSSVPFDLEDILKAAGKSEQQIQSIEDELESLATVESLSRR